MKLLISQQAWQKFTHIVGMPYAYYAIISTDITEFAFVELCFWNSSSKIGPNIGPGSGSVGGLVRLGPFFVGPLAKLFKIGGISVFVKRYAIYSNLFLSVF